MFLKKKYGFYPKNHQRMKKNNRKHHHQLEITKTQSQERIKYVWPEGKNPTIGEQRKKVREYHDKFSPKKRLL